MTMHDNHSGGREASHKDGIDGRRGRPEDHRIASRDAMRVFEALRRAPDVMEPADPPPDETKGAPDEDDLRSILADIGATARAIASEPAPAMRAALSGTEAPNGQAAEAPPSYEDESIDEFEAEDLPDQEMADESAASGDANDGPSAEAGETGNDHRGYAPASDDDEPADDATDGEALALDETSGAEAAGETGQDAAIAAGNDVETDDEEAPLTASEPSSEADQDDEPSEDADDVGDDLRSVFGHRDDRSDALDAAETEDESADLGDDIAPAPLRVPAASVPVSFKSLDDPDEPGRKPRIALMGEFSAGKSTLSNLLIGSNPLPVRVTATQLPPVWIAQGEGQPYCEDVDGETRPIDLQRLGEVDPAETRVVRIFQESEFLELCDIIDMPGISDPNMSPEVWERVIGKADGVIWCTHATQAWRQSEAAVWESLDPALFARSLLLVTRFDKLLTEEDRRRVMKRVARETDGLFSARLPISLTEAMAAGDDADLWAKSGADAFTEAFVEMLYGISKAIGGTPTDRTARPMSRSARPMSRIPSRIGEDAQDAVELRPVTPTRIVPTRVRPVSRRPSVRPDHASHDPHTGF